MTHIIYPQNNVLGAPEAAHKSNILEAGENLNSNEIHVIVSEYGYNLGDLIVKANDHIEEVKTNTTRHKLQELETVQQNLSSITSFLQALDNELIKNPTAKEINLADHSVLVEKMARLTPEIKILQGNTTFNRAEAETLKSAFSRKSQVLMQDVSQKSSSVTRAIEEQTEFTKIMHEALRMNNRLLETLTSNQKSR
jgi:nucleoside diphosphate kinase